MMQANRVAALAATCSLMLFALLSLWAQGDNTAGQQRRDSRSTGEEVLAMKRQYDRALLRGGSSWFERVFADDYLLIVGNGTAYAKTEIVKQLASGEVVWETAVGRDMKVRTYGDTAVVTGRFSGKWRQKGKPVTVEERFTSVWVKDSGRWKAVSEHTSDVPVR